MVVVEAVQRGARQVGAAVSAADVSAVVLVGCDEERAAVARMVSVDREGVES